MWSTTSLREVDVLVVGAGPTGLTLAVELARRGVDHVLVERTPSPALGSRGKGLQPRSLEVLDDLGVIDEILANSTHGMPLRLHQDGRAVAELPTSTFEVQPGVPHPDLLVLPEWRVEQVLRDRLGELGGCVEFGVGLESFDQDDTGVTVTLGDGGVIRARYVVGCDGGRSTVRKRLGATMDGHTHDDQYFLVGDVRVDGLGDDAIHTWFGEDGSFLALAPLPNAGGTWQYQANVLPGEDGTVPEPTPEIFAELFHRRSGLHDVTVRDPAWLSRYRFNARMVADYRYGRVFLAGDAAHVHSPAGGQGMNTGIQDAYNLGWKLAAVLAGGPEHLLDTYGTERIPVAAKVLASSTQGFESVFAQRGIRRLLRDHLILPLVRHPALLRRIIAKTSQLDIAYPDSALTVSAPGRGPRPGDRAPDARSVTSDGVATRLFEAFRGTHWTVLGFGAPSQPHLRAIERRCPGARGHVVLPRPVAGIDAVVSQEAVRLYRARPGLLLLIRPDGHIAVRSKDPAQVIRYLTRWTVARRGRQPHRASTHRSVATTRRSVMSADVAGPGED